MDKWNLIDLGISIKRTRENARMNRTQLAERIGVAPSTITRYERGEFDRISIPVLDAIANALGTTSARLINGSVEAEKPMEKARSQYMQTVGAKIRLLRNQRGLSLDALARLSGYETENARSAMHKIESGNVDLPLTRLMAIAIALDVTPQYLAGWNEEEEEYAMDDETIRNRERFGRCLTAYLRQADIRQAELAEKMGVSTATTSDWCSGKKFPTITNFRKLASMLHVPVETVFGWAVPEIENKLNAERGSRYEDDLR